MKILVIFVATWAILTTISSAKYQFYNQNDGGNYESFGDRLVQRNLKKGGGKKGGSKGSPKQIVKWIVSKFQKNSKNDQKNNKNNKNSQKITNSNKQVQSNKKSNNSSNSKQNTSSYKSQSLSSNIRQNNLRNQSNNQNSNQVNTNNYRSNHNYLRNSNRNHNQNRAYNTFNELNHNRNRNRNYNNQNGYFRNRQQQKEMYELFKERIETWTTRLKMAQFFKDQEDQEVYRMKNLEVNWKNRDNLVQSVLNMERSIYSEQDKLASFYKNQYQKKTNRLLKADAKFFKKNKGKLVRNLNWKNDIFQ